MPLTHVCLLNAPGTYAEWPGLSGAPMPWQAAQLHDAAFIEATAQGQRQSFGVDLPSIAGDDNLVSAILRGYASRPDDSGDFADGSFENGTWTLTHACPTNGASITSTGSLVRTGTKALRLDGGSAGPRCGEGRKVINNLTPGVTYGITFYFKTLNFLAGFELRTMVDGGTIDAVSVASPTSFTLRGPVTFVATAASHEIGFNVPAAASGLRTFAVDDVSFGRPGGDAILVPFYRLYGQDHDLPAWTVPLGTLSPVLLPNVAISGIPATWFRDGGFEIGVRSGGPAPARLDQLEFDLTLQSLRERVGFVAPLRRR